MRYAEALFRPSDPIETNRLRGRKLLRGEELKTESLNSIITISEGLINSAIKGLGFPSLNFDRKRIHFLPCEAYVKNFPKDPCAKYFPEPDLAAISTSWHSRQQLFDMTLEEMMHMASYRAFFFLPSAKNASVVQVGYQVSSSNGTAFLGLNEALTNMMRMEISDKSNAELDICSQNKMQRRLPGQTHVHYDYSQYRSLVGSVMRKVARVSQKPYSEIFTQFKKGLFSKKDGQNALDLAKRAIGQKDVEMLGLLGVNHQVDSMVFDYFNSEDKELKKELANASRLHVSLMTRLLTKAVMF